MATTTISNRSARQPPLPFALLLALLAGLAGLALTGCNHGVRTYNFPGVTEAELVESFRRVSGPTAAAFGETHFGGPAWTEAAVNPAVGEAGVSLSRQYHDVSLMMMPLDRAGGEIRADQVVPNGATVVFTAQWQHWFGVVGNRASVVKAWVDALGDDLGVEPVPLIVKVSRREMQSRFGSDGLEFASNRGQMDGPTTESADQWLTRWTAVGEEGTQRSLEFWEYE